MEIDTCKIAQHAIRSALLTWGHAWTKIDRETREAQLALEIVKYMAGNQWCSDDVLPRQDNTPWTAKDCFEALQHCKNWSDGTYGASLAVMAYMPPGDPKQDRLTIMFTDVYGFPYKG
jgi:hypothetical protein